MNENTLVVVHCYEGDRALVENFMPVFTHHERPVLLLSPGDAPVNINDDQVTSQHAGNKGWKGPQTIRRQMEHWRLALEHPSQAQWFLLNDADSMCLSPEIPTYLYVDPSKLWCNVLCHENEHQADDHPNLNPPYFMSRSVLQALLDKAESIGEIPQDAFLEPHDWGQAIDGFYTHLVIDLLSIPYGDFPDGITTWPRGRPDLFKYVENEGAVFLHGVKTSNDLSLLMLQHKAWKLRNATEMYTAYSGLVDGETISVEL